MSVGKPRLFTTVPTRAISDTALTALDLRCLMVISLHDGMSAVRGNGGGCYAKSATLADLARTDISNFSKSVSRLLKLGYVTREAQQNDKRRFTLRVIFAEEDAWRTDQQSDDMGSGELVGETTKQPSDLVGNPAKCTSEIVGEGDLENGRIPGKTDPHYILQSRELDFDESKEIDSAEAAQRAFSAPRRVKLNSISDPGPAAEKDPTKVELGRRKMVSIAALLPTRFEALPTPAQLASFERAFAGIGRDPEAIEPSERKLYESLLFTIADAFSGEREGYQAQRLMAELETVAPTEADDRHNSAFARGLQRALQPEALSAAQAGR